MVFDFVNHKTLIEKIIGIGVRGVIVDWICNFPHNRQQSVKFILYTFRRSLHQCWCPAGYETGSNWVPNLDQQC